MSTPENPAPISDDLFDGAEYTAGGSEPLPPANYFATFKGVEKFTNAKVPEPKLRWVWEIVTGPHKGRLATALTDPKLTPQTHAGRLLSGLAGRPLVGETPERLRAILSDAVGKRWVLMVAPGPKGGKPSVQSVGVSPAAE